MQKVQIISTAEKFDLFARNYDRTTDNEAWDDAILDTLGNVTGKLILDIGSGTGRLASKLSHLGARVIGIDISEKMIDISSHRCLSDTEFIQSDLFDFQPSQPFDVVISVFTFCYIENKEHAFSKVFSFLKAGGMFVLLDTLQTEDTVVGSIKGVVAAPFFPNQPKVLSNLMQKVGFVIDERREVYSSRTFTTYGSLIAFLVRAEKPHAK